jgi:hypothetical protein
MKVYISLREREAAQFGESPNIKQLSLIAEDPLNDAQDEG